MHRTIKPTQYQAFKASHDLMVCQNCCSVGKNRMAPPREKLHERVPSAKSFYLLKQNHAHVKGDPLSTFNPLIES